MNGFLARQLHEITAWLHATGRSLLTSAVLLIIALVFSLAAFAFLSVALYFYVAELTRPAVAALAVAGFHVLIAATCLIMFRLKGQRKPTQRPAANQQVADSGSTASAELSQSIDETMAPLIAVLHEANMKPEEAALRLGVAMTKQVGPLALIGLAIAAGFMFGQRVRAPRKS